ncbi:STAS domain-containing protein [Amycolatopsis sp. FDAARGOS 1241]|uniref:STAS domain-containing protein n=1 Tax=Amycolatopsis sp. FDAARGOS 1241 TaxID=2778070 RepID=UPI0019520988|nr:STAS domain-containing protein [Amycolatopsis sp. FDAARGOS 1241]QRP50079.1 STAS domain-containing protein [Amycolatopsis sp. FDAARGOS 1241]
MTARRRTAGPLPGADEAVLVKERVRTVQVRGPLDTAGAADFGQQLQTAALDGRSDVVVDVTAASDISVAGVRVLLRFAEALAAERRRVRVVTGERLVARLIWAAHAGDLLDLHLTIRSARAAAERGHHT